MSTAPAGGFRAQCLEQIGIDAAALGVGRFQRHGADDVAQGGAGQVDDLVLVVVDVVLRTFDALLVHLDLEIDLRVDAGVQVVVGDDLLRQGVDHLLGGVHLEHAVNDRDDPVEAGVREALVPAQPLDQTTVSGADDADPRQKQEDKDEKCKDPKAGGVEFIHVASLQRTYTHL